MPKYIFIVDDSEAVRHATRHYLENITEFQVCGEAVDGVDALEKLRYLNPDLIILDLSMPRMNGLQTARKIRAILDHVPIILFTMFADAVPPQTAQAAGITAVVSKTDSLELYQRIETLLAAAA